MKGMSRPVIVSIVDGVVMGPAAGLAICKYEEEAGFYLFGCDQNWHPITDTFHDSVDDAKSQAEVEYVGVSNTWQEL